MLFRNFPHSVVHLMHSWISFIRIAKIATDTPKFIFPKGSVWGKQINKIYGECREKIKKHFLTPSLSCSLSVIVLHRLTFKCQLNLLFSNIIQWTTQYSISLISLSLWMYFNIAAHNVTILKISLGGENHLLCLDNSFSW